MNILGAILAGGAARRFGADKALATLHGVTLIDHVAATLHTQADAVIVCGRDGGLPDRPAGVGPLGGIAAALSYASGQGFNRVVTVPCDTPVLPDDLVERLGKVGGACFVEGLPVIGIWPSTLSTILDAYLATAADRSIRGWARHVGAAPVRFDTGITNVNTRADLATLTARVSG